MHEVLLGIALFVVCMIAIKMDSDYQHDKEFACPECGCALIDNIYYSGSSGAAVPTKHGKKCPQCGYHKPSKKKEGGIMNKKGQTVFAVFLMSIPCTVAATMIVATAVGSVVQPNGPAQMRQDRKRIWCQVQNKGKNYCKAQYPRL